MINPRVKGFTLIELMIVVAIVAIIAAVAYPSYKNAVVDGYRGTAQADLLALASAMERHYSGTFTYEKAAKDGGNTGAPAIFAAYSPSSEPSDNKRYTLTIESANATSFALKATPTSGTSQVGDGDLYYYSNGIKGWDKDGNGLSNAEKCWSC
ncbi:prepilin-type N-terminal cleavage/methylation domain-containing protein [Alteromonas sp. V450]|uniref:type IV pilin protein n=1 Tax=Alteromonas sp. V450 TaxID=1912139 RepID=UPI0008FF5118|nr:type IV pilin protein [Alteromonas sp. V450]OJF68698.1 prepilin-type N-terminal cleavage/methylation domain-containing protein [Alteromonas sp. V450]